MLRRFPKLSRILVFCALFALLRWHREEYVLSQGRIEQLDLELFAELLDKIRIGDLKHDMEYPDDPIFEEEA